MIKAPVRESMAMDEMSIKPVRRVKVSKQRQISIPKAYYEALKLADEAIIEFTGKEIIIRPAQQESVDFSPYILEDLIKQGYEGEELLQEFKRIKENIPHALDLMVHDTMNRPAITGDLEDYFHSLEDISEDE
jgi:bifunctional DNA-binding transcriptional regulator/antitoxin component of YhaV-PrlF toxin-antitoxin module